MSDTYEVQQVEDSALWDALVQEADGGTVFSTSAWMTAVGRALGEKVVFYGCYKNGHLIAGCPVLLKGKGRFARAATPILTPYGGFLYARVGAKRWAKVEAEQSRAATLLIERLEKEAAYFALAHHPDIHDIRWFLWRGWHVRVNYTYHIDIADLHLLWDRFENRTKTVIRKAEREGFYVGSGEEDLEQFMVLYERIYRKQGIPPPVPVDVVRRCVETITDTGLSRMYTAMTPSGEVVSAVVFILGEEALYAWISGADPAFNESGATSLLYWRVFEEMSARYTTFDFVGANKPSIAKFKRGFGGELVPYYVTERYAPGVRGWVIRLGKRLRRLL
jgi:hypothetical protein